MTSSDAHHLILTRSGVPSCVYSLRAGDAMVRKFSLRSRAVVVKKERLHATKRNGIFRVRRPEKVNAICATHLDAMFWRSRSAAGRSRERAGGSGRTPR